MLNLIAGQLSTNSIEYADKTEIAFFGQTNIDRLNPALTVEEEVTSINPNLNRSKIRSICGTMLFSGDSAEKKIAVLSGGEKSRVLLAKLLVKPANLLLLDEPTNHLDMESCQALTVAIKDYPGTVVFVTHDEGLLKSVANRLIVYDRGKIDSFDIGYQDFLNKIGWEGEEASSSSDTSLTNAERKKQRSQINKEKQEQIKPLSRQISKVEKQIMQLEDEINQQTKLMLESSGSEVAEISKFIGQTQNQVDELYDSLELLADQENQLEQKFKERLAKLLN